MKVATETPLWLNFLAVALIKLFKPLEGATLN